MAARFFLATIISYIDRQTLSVNAPFIRDDLGLTNVQYSELVTAFLVAYTIGQSVTGRLGDAVVPRLTEWEVCRDGAAREAVLVQRTDNLGQELVQRGKCVECRRAWNLGWAKPRGDERLPGRNDARVELRLDAQLASLGV